MLKDNNKVRITSSDSRSLILVISSLRGGGAERVMANIANYFVKVGVSVTLITFEATADDRYSLSPLVKRILLPNYQSQNILLKPYDFIHRLWHLRKALKKSGTKVVLSFLTETNVAVILMSFGLGIKCVVSERTDPQFHKIKLHWGILRNLFYRYAEVVVVQNTKIQNWFQQFTVARIKVIPNMLDKQCFSLGRQFKECKNIIAVGRLIQGKGYDILIQAFAALHKRYPDWTLTILGDGVERVKLDYFVASLGLVGWVHFYGNVKNPSEYFSQASFMVHASRYEGFPNAVAEGMAHGLAVIATEPAGDMLIKHNENGLLVPVDDIERLTEVMVKLVEDVGLRERLGKEASKVIALLDPEVIMKRWEGVLFDSTCK